MPLCKVVTSQVRPQPEVITFIEQQKALISLEILCYETLSCPTRLCASLGQLQILLLLL